jgi:hypothetical protein
MHLLYTKKNALPRPALEGGDDKEGEHGLQHIVIVEVVPFPQPLLLIHLLFHLQEYVTWWKTGWIQFF